MRNELQRAGVDPAYIRTADFEASRAADEEISANVSDDKFPEESMELEVERAEEAAANVLGDKDVVARELKDSDELVDTAEGYERAIRAAADCRLRRGS